MIARRSAKTAVRALSSFLLCAGIATAVTAPMLSAGYPLTHSTHFNLSWVFQFQAQVDGGQWYPRWMEYSNYGFGNPTFAFYPPLCMLATLPFHAMGLDIQTSLVASMGLAVVVFVAGIYQYARHYFPQWIAASSTVIAGSTPYLCVDLYQRGAIAEVWGIAVTPWLLWVSQWALERFSTSFNHRQIQWVPVICVAIAYGCLILSHLPTVLMVTCLWGLLPFSGGRYRWSTVQLFGGALLGGCWTAAYFWPVLFDRGLIQVDALNALAEYRPRNRLMLEGLFSFHPQLTHHWFDRSLISPWLTAIVLVMGSALVWVWFERQNPGRSPRRLQVTAGYWLLISAIALLMTTDVLGWAYRVLPPLQRIQFSWRWMTVLCTTVPLLMGYLLDVARRHLNGYRRLLSAAAIALVLAVGMATLTLSVRAIEQAAYDPAAIAQFTQLAERKSFPHEPTQQPRRSFLYWHWIHPDGLGLVDVPEYRHYSASLMMPPTRAYPLLEWQDAGETGLPEETGLTVLRWEYGLRQFRARNSGEAPRVVQLRTFFYPGWVTQLGDRRVLSESSNDGQLQVSIPPGTHEVTVRYRGTVAHRVGLWVSGFTIAAIAIRIVLVAHQPTKQALNELE